MICVLFVCHGNICRSPMAEYIMKNLVKKEGLEGSFYIASAATTTEEIGNPVYPPVQRLLAEKGISTKGHAARQITRRDYEDYDMIIPVDNETFRACMRICGGDPDNKITMLNDYSGEGGEIEDPWYTGRYDRVYDAIYKDCTGLLEKLKKEENPEE